jgi:phosphate transport system substrate-binding protein
VLHRGPLGRHDVATPEAATIKGTGNDLSLKIDYATKAAGAYPIILVTYEIVCTKYADPAKGAAVKSFMSYLTSDAFQSSLTQIGSAPLPAPILAKVKTAVASIS